MAELMEASHQWATRRPDERYTSLETMRDVAQQIKKESRENVCSTKDLKFSHIDDRHVTIALKGQKSGGKFIKPVQLNMTHWAFNQLCNRITCPGEFMRRLPAELAARNLNQCVEDCGDSKVQLLTRENGIAELRSVTSEGYGRIWNADILRQVVDNFGDGVNPANRFRVPGEFGKRVEVNTDNTTLYMSDRDMFVFLTDEENRVNCPIGATDKAGRSLGDFTFGIVKS